MLQVLTCLFTGAYVLVNNAFTWQSNHNCNIFTGGPLSKTNFQWSPAHTVQIYT